MLWKSWCCLGSSSVAMVCWRDLLFRTQIRCGQKLSQRPKKSTVLPPLTKLRKCSKYSQQQRDYVTTHQKAFTGRRRQLIPKKSPNKVKRRWRRRQRRLATTKKTATAKKKLSCCQYCNKNCGCTYVRTTYFV